MSSFFMVILIGSIVLLIVSLVASSIYAVGFKSGCESGLKRRSINRDAEK
jgi:hypothetical protein